MMYFVLLGLYALSASEGVRAVANPPRLSGHSSKSSPLVLQAPVRRGAAPSTKESLTHSWYRNVSTPRTNITNIMDGYEYFVDLLVGTPPQTVSVILDTGSDQTWLNPQCDSMSHQAICDTTGQYNHSESTTAANLSAQYSITYGSGAVDGWYFRDDFVIAEEVVSSVQFGVAEFTMNLDAGILGMGRDSVFLDELVGQGAIDSKDFSVTLGLNGEDSGQLVFGGVDTKKYYGSLQGVPLLYSEGLFSPTLHYDINLTYMGVTSKGSCRSEAASDSTFWYPTIVDTGSTVNHLPFDVVNRTAALIPGARFDSYLQMWKVSCHYTDSADTVDFGFGDTAVHIPMKEFIWRNIPAGGQCFLGMIGDADSIGFSVLGDTFMRALVTLFQPEGQMVYFAPYVDCGTEIESTKGGGRGRGRTSRSDAKDIKGKCKRPSWDTCAERPTPEPLEPTESPRHSVGWPLPSDFPTDDPSATETDFSLLEPSPPPRTDDSKGALNGPLRDQDQMTQTEDAWKESTGFPWPPVITGRPSFSIPAIVSSQSTTSTTCVDLDGSAVECETAPPLPLSSFMPLRSSSSDGFAFPTMPTTKPKPEPKPAPVTTLPECITQCWLPPEVMTLSSPRKAVKAHTTSPATSSETWVAAGPPEGPGDEPTCATYCRVVETPAPTPTSSVSMSGPFSFGDPFPLSSLSLWDDISSWFLTAWPTAFPDLTMPLPSTSTLAQESLKSTDLPTATTDVATRPVISSGCSETSFCLLVFTTLGSASVSTAEECQTYTTCGGGDPTPFPHVATTATADASSTMAAGSCDAVYVTVTTTVTTTDTACIYPDGPGSVPELTKKAKASNRARALPRAGARRIQLV